VPAGSLDFWQERLERNGTEGLAREERFAEQRLAFAGPDGEGFALVEVNGDERAPWLGGGVPTDKAVRGFHSATLRLHEAGPTEELLAFMGYDRSGRDGNMQRFVVPVGNNAQLIDVEARTDLPRAQQGAGSVHHIAFAVGDRAAQLAAREALVDAGYQLTPVIDRDYFFAIYFRTPGGVLFEIATNEPGFSRDEDLAHLGEALKLPTQHAHLRSYLEEHLPAIEA
jgi:glyoxalase family protein